MKRILLLGIAAGVGLAGCKRAAPAAAGPYHLVVQADWYAQPEYGGFYQALAKGYYRAAGLDVEIRQGSSGTVPQQVVAAGRADFGIGNSSDVIIAASRGVPLVMVGALMQRDPQAIMFHTESGIHRFQDLNGKNLMTVPGTPFLAVIQHIYGIKMSVTPTDFGLSRFMANPNWIQQCFVTNEPYYATRNGAHVGVLMVSDSGFSPYRVWYTRRRFLLEHPAVAKAFTEATIRGWTDYIQGDPAPANALIAALNPRMDAPYMAYDRQAMKDRHLVEGDPTKGEAIGQINPTRVALLISQLKDAGELGRPIQPAAVLP